MKEILKLYKNKKIVFYFDDLKINFSIPNTKVLKNKLQYFKAKDILSSQMG
jgi:hypothetical protein